jgi:hypothetical protein
MLNFMDTQLQRKGYYYGMNFFLSLARDEVKIAAAHV